MRVITFSRYFPVAHPKKGINTFFPEQILNSLGVKSPHDVCETFKPFVNDFAMLEGSKKHHTIRSGNRWKVGDWFSPRIWSGKPYASKQIEFAPPIQIKKIWTIEILFRPDEWIVRLNGLKLWDEITDFVMDDFVETLAKNDGLAVDDFINWFDIHPKKVDSFNGQILCWNENVNYLQL